MTSLMHEDQDVTVPTHALDQAREVLRQVAAGDPVDTPAAAAEAARALAALPPRHALR